MEQHVVSVRCAALITKEKKEWTLKHNTRHNRYWLCIEDPFETTHNLGRVADRNTYGTFAYCFFLREFALALSVLDFLLSMTCALAVMPDTQHTRLFLSNTY